ncbi:MAG: glutamine amidotransferase [Proteobacteria bacterium]|nr:glutamine amidotransferase [Pseudomonadota bacterium]
MAETSNWSLQFGIPGGLPAGLAMAVVIGAVVVLGWIELTQVVPSARRRLLRGMRVLSGSVALLLALQPRLVEERVHRRAGSLAVLADTSRSMMLRHGDRTRAEAARALLQRWLDAGIAREVRVFQMGDKAEEVRHAELAKSYPTTRDDTRIAAAVEAVLRADPNNGLGAIVLVSDGRNLEKQPAVERLRDLGLRVHTVALGASTELRDDAITQVLADRVAFLRQPARVDVNVRSVGGKQRQLSLQLRRNGELIRTAAIDLSPGGEGHTQLVFAPSTLRRAVYELSIPVASDDAVPQNNKRAFLLHVKRNRLRALLICGAPSWDARFMRAFLKADPSNDLITFFILRTANDLIMAAPGELSLIRFPADELFSQHLASFDVVLFADFEYGPYRMARYLMPLRDYVLAGGALAMLGGRRSFVEGGYRDTPLAEVLPVRLDTANTAPLIAPFRPRPAQGAENHPLVALASDRVMSQRLWAGLAPLQGANRVGDVADGALALLVHPRERTRSGRAFPVLSVRKVGSGRTLALATDTSWRWGFATAGHQGDASAYGRFWDRALRWLVADPALEPSRLRTHRDSYVPSARLRVDLTLRDELHRPEAAEVVVELLRPGSAPLARHRLQTDGQGKGRLEIDAPATPGGYRLRVPSAHADRARADVDFVVESGGRELADPRADPRLLRDIARATGGASYADPDAAPNLDGFEATRTRALRTLAWAPFGSLWFFAICVVVFCGEWAMRRRFGRP